VRSRMPAHPLQPAYATPCFQSPMHKHKQSLLLGAWPRCARFIVTTDAPISSERQSPYAQIALGAPLGAREPGEDASLMEEVAARQCHPALIGSHRL